MAFKDLTNKDKEELREVIDQMTAVSVDSVEKIELAIAQGCPRTQLIPIVNRMTENEQFKLKPRLMNLKSIVESKLGPGAFDEEEIVSLIESLVRNNHDLIHFRKLVAGFAVSSLVVNTIVDIRTRSPLDSGKALFDELVQIEGSQVLENELKDEEASEHEEIGLNDVIEKQEKFINPEIRKIIIDVALGVGLGVSAIALLV